ncbi:unnamed protein product, partial [Effrenium voratum]
QVERQRQQLGQSFSALASNPHGMSEGELLRSQALERRVQQLIERREQRAKSRTGTPPRAVPPAPAPAGAQARPHSGSPVPRAGYAPIQARMQLQEEGAIYGPEAGRFQMDPAAVMTARHWSPGHARPETTRFDLDPVTGREWPRPGAIPAGRAAPSYARPMLGPGGFVSQDSSPRRGGPSYEQSPCSMPGMGASTATFRERSPEGAYEYEGEGYEGYEVDRDRDDMPFEDIMEQSRKAAEDALYRDEAGRRKAERERSKAAEERKRMEQEMQQAEEQRSRAERDFAEAEQKRREEAKQRQREKRGAAMRKQQEGEKKRREEEEEMQRIQDQMEAEMREQREAAERERAERERAMADEAERLMKGKGDPKLNPRRFFAQNAKLDGKARKDEVEKVRELLQRLMMTEAARFVQAVWRARPPRKALKTLKAIEREKLLATKRRLAEAAEKIARNKEQEKLKARLKEISVTEAILRDVWAKWRERSAITVQAHFRGAMARKRFAVRFAQFQREKLAAREERKRTWAERQVRWKQEAKVARRKAWDAEVAAMRERVSLMDLERKERERAALKLQAALRGQLERRRLRKSGRLMEDRLKAAVAAERKKKEEAEKRRKEAFEAAQERKRQQEVLRAQEAIQEFELRWKTYHATKIQSMVRARNDRRTAAAEKAKKEAELEAKRAEQRREEERLRRLAEEKRLQDALRAQQMGVGAMRKMLEDRENRRLGQYIIKLQARWRGKMARRRYAEVREIIKREKQKERDGRRARNVAEWKERKRLEELRKKEKRVQEVSSFSKRLHEVEFTQKNRAARVLQGAYRCRRAKLQLRNLKHEREEQEYAKKANLKMKLERERKEKFAEQKAKEAKAKAKLQREVEHYRHKVDAMEFKKQDEAAVRIQSIFKGNAQRFRFATLKKLSKEKDDMEQSRIRMEKKHAEEMRLLDEQRKANQLKMENEQKKYEDKYRMERARADQKTEEEKEKAEKKVEQEIERLESKRIKMEQALEKERERIEKEREMLMEEMEGAVGTVGVAGGGAGSGSGAAMRGGAVPVGPLGSKGPTMPYKSVVKASMETRKEEHMLAKEKQLESTLKKLAEAQEAAAVAAAAVQPAPGALLEEARPPAFSATVAARSNQVLQPSAVPEAKAKSAKPDEARKM